MTRHISHTKLQPSIWCVLHNKQWDALHLVVFGMGHVDGVCRAVSFHSLPRSRHVRARKPADPEVCIGDSAQLIVAVQARRGILEPASEDFAFFPVVGVPPRVAIWVEAFDVAEDVGLLDMSSHTLAPLNVVADQWVTLLAPLLSLGS